MDWIDQINRYLLSVIDRRRANANPRSSSHSPMSPALVHELACLYLISLDRFVGETLALWGTLADGAPTAISEADAGWADMRSALEQSGRLNFSMPEAELRLMADPHRRPVCLVGDADALQGKPADGAEHPPRR